MAIGLGLDVERFLAPPQAAFVAGDYESPDLRPQLLVMTAAGALGVEVEQAGDLGVDVDLPALPAAPAAVGLGLEHLPRLGLHAESAGGGHDEELRAEVRALVVARNERRLRRGEEPLDVEAETDRELADLIGFEGR